MKKYLLIFTILFFILSASFFGMWYFSQKPQKPGVLLITNDKSTAEEAIENKLPADLEGEVTPEDINAANESPISHTQSGIDSQTFPGKEKLLSCYEKDMLLYELNHAKDKDYSEIFDSENDVNECFIELGDQFSPDTFDVNDASTASILLSWIVNYRGEDYAHFYSGGISIEGMNLFKKLVYLNNDISQYNGVDLYRVVTILLANEDMFAFELFSRLALDGKLETDLNGRMGYDWSHGGADNVIKYFYGNMGTGVTQFLLDNKSTFTEEEKYRIISSKYFCKTIFYSEAITGEQSSSGQELRKSLCKELLDSLSESKKQQINEEIIESRKIYEEFLQQQKK